MTTGRRVPIWSWVLALKAWTNSIMGSPWGPSAVPTGGAGFACPPRIASFISVFTFFAICVF